MYNYILFDILLYMLCMHLAHFLNLAIFRLQCCEICGGMKDCRIQMIHVSADCAIRTHCLDFTTHRLCHRVCVTTPEVLMSCLFCLRKSH